MSMNENKMGTMKVSKLLINMSLPMVISMLVQSLYNIVDSLFVANIPLIGEDCMNALTLAMPVQQLIISISVGIGVAINAVLAKAIGEKNPEKADVVAGNIILIGLFFSFIFMLFGVFFSQLYFETQTSNPDVIRYGTIYLTIIASFSIAKVFQIIFERVLQATGRTFYTMVTQASGAVLNIGLDYVLIYQFNMGIKGAAIATIIAQIFSMLMAFYFNHHYNHDVNLGLKYLKIDREITKEIFEVAVPAIMMQALMAFGTLFTNMILIRISEQTVTAYGIYMKLNSIVFMIVFGINNAMIPIIGYNYGAKKYERIHQVIRYGLTYSISIFVVGLALFEIFPLQLLGLFNASEELIAIGIYCFRITPFVFLFASISIPLEGALQSMGGSKQALIVTVLRLVIIQLPVAWLLTYTANPQIFVWFSFPISEICGMLYCIYAYKKIVIV